MNLNSTPRRPPRENFVPMINVVFLLLVFFLMTAQIAPPEPFEVIPPESGAETPAERGTTLFVSADGDLAMQGLSGKDAVLAHLQSWEPGLELTLRADARVQADTVATLLPQLAGVGVARLKLISMQR